MSASRASLSVAPFESDAAIMIEGAGLVFGGGNRLDFVSSPVKGSNRRPRIVAEEHPQKHAGRCAGNDACAVLHCEKHPAAGGFRRLAYSALKGHSVSFANQHRGYYSIWREKTFR